MEIIHTLRQKKKNIETIEKNPNLNTLSSLCDKIKFHIMYIRQKLYLK